MFYSLSSGQTLGPGPVARGSAAGRSLIDQPTTWVEAIDVVNDYLADFPPNITEKFRLSTNEHTMIGLYLITSGIVVGLLNSAAIVAFFRFPKALMTPSALPELALMVSDLGVGGIHPYSGSSALANRWLWGPAGCQAYATAGFLFGNLQVVLVNFVAVDRALLVCRPKWGRSFRTYKSYARVLAGCVLLCLVFSVVPLLGMGRYGLLATKILCTINYMNPDPYYSAYLTAMLIWICLIPELIGAVAVVIMNRRLAKPNAPKIHFASQTNYAMVNWAALLITPAAYSVYAIVCVWALAAAHPTDVPRFLVPMPPLFGKMAGLFNPIAYVYANPLLYACVRATFGLPHDKAVINEAEAAREAEVEERERAERKAMIEHDG